jgi:hypothetical protein
MGITGLFFDFQIFSSHPAQPMRLLRYNSGSKITAIIGALFMIERLHSPGGNGLGFKAEGVIGKEDVSAVEPQIEIAIKNSHKHPIGLLSSSKIADTSPPDLGKQCLKHAPFHQSLTSQER